MVKDLKDLPQHRAPLQDNRLGVHGCRFRGSAWGPLPRAVLRQNGAVLHGVQQRIQAIRSCQAATMVYTSGTTGNPKSLALFHDALFWSIRLPLKLLLTEQPPKGHHRILLYRAGPGTWVCLTPDHGVQVHDLRAQRHEVLAIEPDRARAWRVKACDGAQETHPATIHLIWGDQPSQGSLLPNRQ